VKLTEAAEWIKQSEFDRHMQDYSRDGTVSKTMLFVKKCVRSAWTGHDNCHRPVHFSRFGSACHGRYLAELTREECLSNCQWMLADILHQIRVANESKPSDMEEIVHQAVLVKDITGFSLDVLSLLSGKGKEIFAEHSAMERKHFPGQIKNVYVVNCSWFIRMAWASASLFFHADTAAKFVLLGEDFLGELLKVMPLNAIPVEWGGSSKVEVPLPLSEEELMHLTYTREHAEG
jgi:hypothetical protein